MEVDLVCQELSLAIELDGAQHFADLAAYRRDRRKDALLQENGYLVLRFLAEDVCEQLNDVLDSILRALSHLKARQVNGQSKLAFGGVTAPGGAVSLSEKGAYVTHDGPSLASGAYFARRGGLKSAHGGAARGSPVFRTWKVSPVFRALPEGRRARASSAA